MLKLFWKILIDEQGSTLAITRKTANTLITASGFNTNYDEIEAEVNSLDTANYADDSVTAAKVASDIVRTNFGLIQHSDGSLYVDVSDTNPGLELSDGGLRVKAYGLAQRTSNGLDIGQSGDLLLSSAASPLTGWSDVSATYADKFIRISATALSTGGADTHSHAVGTLVNAAEASHTHANATAAASGIQGDFPGGGPTTAGSSHNHAISGSTASGDNVPSYVSTKMFQKS